MAPLPARITASGEPAGAAMCTRRCGCSAERTTGASAFTWPVVDSARTSRPRPSGMLKTADSGYLTRRLVDVSQDLIISEYDCGTVDGIDIPPHGINEANVLWTVLEGATVWRDPSLD
jgi:hypothetical protein